MAETDFGSRHQKIGGVTLDLTYYSGEDLYSDGDIENEMLDIACGSAPEQFQEVIEERKSWPVFYHFSPLRSNIIGWLPFRKTDKVLEIGAGCGAITGALAEKVASVTCVELSKKRSLVNAHRNKGHDNITVMVGNFKDIEPHLANDYDYVLLIGVFEYGQAYIGGEKPYEDFMEICSRHRRTDGGRLVIAIENKFGLKYWAGCCEDHLGTYFSGLEGYREGGPARTFTRGGLEKILRRVGLEEYAFYYPYPDYKFMTTVYSDKYLPGRGELSDNIRNFDRDRMLLFDEKQVFDEILEEGQFPLFSNSYLLVVGEAMEVVYAKFSNDRAPKWAVRTVISQDACGQRYVRKIPDTEAACEHLRHMMQACDSLRERYRDTPICIADCSAVEGDIQKGLSFAYCEGTTLESILDEKLAAGDMKGLRTLIDEYMHWLKYREDEYGISNIDFIFSNILIEGSRWHVIDYEWVLDEYVAAEKIAFRAFYNYMLGGGLRCKCEEMFYQEILGLTAEQIEEAAREELRFQKEITSGRAAAGTMRDLIGNRVYPLREIIGNASASDGKYAAQFYYDYGDGFKEEHSVRVAGALDEEGNLRLTRSIPAGVVRMRIDPCSCCCRVTVRETRVEERIYALEDMEINGYRLKDGSVVFDNEDPHFTVRLESGTGGRLSLDMHITEVSEELAGRLVSQSSWRGKLRGIRKAIRSRLAGRR